MSDAVGHNVVMEIEFARRRLRYFYLLSVVVVDSDRGRLGLQTHASCELLAYEFSKLFIR